MSNKEIRKTALNKFLKNWKKVFGFMFVYCLLIGIISLVFAYLGNLLGLSEITSLLNLIINIPLSYSLMGVFIDIYDDESIKITDYIVSVIFDARRACEIALMTMVRMIIPIIMIFVSIIFITKDLKSTTDVVKLKSCCYDCYGDWQNGTCAYEESACYKSCLNHMGVEDVERPSPILEIGQYILLFGGIIWLIVLTYNYVLTQIIGITNNNLSAFDVPSESKRLMKNNKFRFFKLQFTYIVVYSVLIFLSYELIEYCYVMFDIPLLVYYIIPVICIIVISALYMFAQICFYDLILDIGEKTITEENNYMDTNYIPSNDFNNDSYNNIPSGYNIDNSQTNTNLYDESNNNNSEEIDSLYSILDSDELNNRIIYK